MRAHFAVAMIILLLAAGVVYGQSSPSPPGPVPSSTNEWVDVSTKIGALGILGYLIIYVMPQIFTKIDSNHNETLGMVITNAAADRLSQESRDKELSKVMQALARYIGRMTEAQDASVLQGAGHTADLRKQREIQKIMLRVLQKRCDMENCPLRTTEKEDSSEFRRRTDEPHDPANDS